MAVDTPTRLAYTVREVSLATGISEHNIRARISRGTLPSHRLGRTVMVPAEVVNCLGIVPEKL